MMVEREQHGNWKGGRSLNAAGYWLALAPKHPRAHKTNRYVFEHILIAERVIGRFLPPGAEVHHANEEKGDNRSANLVICQDRAYHQLLHRRTRALRGCGNVTWRRCWICGQWDEPEHLYLKPNTSEAFHRSCRRQRRIYEEPVIAASAR